MTKLGSTVNSESIKEDSPYVAWAGSYLPFRREGKEGTNADLYVSFPQGDDT